jgi:hypothetical protein
MPACGALAEAEPGDSDMLIFRNQIHRKPLSMKVLIFLLALIAWPAWCGAQEAFSSVEERMTGQEFVETGLHKLTEEELRALNRWLSSHSVATLEDASGRYQAMSRADSEAGYAQGDQRGFDTDSGGDEDDSTIVSRINGTFSGWDGATVFQLENGMVWKQTDDSKFAISPVENPVVTIKSGWLRSWRLSLEGYDEKVKVERIQ